MFYHVLALRLGRTVRELLASLSGQELTDWFAFNRISPLADWGQLLAPPKASEPAAAELSGQVRVALLNAAGPFVKKRK